MNWINNAVRGVLAISGGFGIAKLAEKIEHPIGRVAVAGVGSAIWGATCFVAPNPFEKKGQTSQAPVGQPTEVKVEAQKAPATT